MPDTAKNSLGDYFTDPSQQPPDGAVGPGQQHVSENGQASQAKRCSACTLCRKRKLKCDGAKPACSTCSRLQHTCSYDEVRKKSGPKRGYVKLLEARLAQVESLLNSQRDQPKVASVNRNENMMNGQSNENAPVNVDLGLQVPSARPLAQAPLLSSMSASDNPSNDTAATEATYPWELISLGLDEPLPIQSVVDDLNQIYFDKIHVSLPMMHRPRYYAAMHLAPHTRPPVCLRYAMWCNAAAVTDKYDGLQEHFYLRARKYIQQDEMKGHGESMITIAHVQTWVLLALYEFKRMYFPRAWMSSGRASRMSQMMCLHRLETSTIQAKHCLLPARDWTEQEERRRTFWATFCIDRYSSIGTGWSMSIEEQEIQTMLPGSDQSFDLSKPETAPRTMLLADALGPAGPAGLSSFAGVVLMAALFGRNLTHLHRPSPGDQDDDLNGEFWKRHRDLDAILLNTSLSLPDHLRLPSQLNNPNAVFLNMSIHTSTICLHQAAIFKIDRNSRIPARMGAESKVRCITAAAETANIMRIISHLDLSAMNPFISFCIYVAARVFVQYLRSRPNDQQIQASLRFLLSAMHAIKKKIPLTESFLVQLDVDLESAGLNSLRLQTTNPDVYDRLPACYQKHAGISGVRRIHPPTTYGDLGLAAFNSPDQNVVDATNHTVAFDVVGVTQGSESSALCTGLPLRQRTSDTLIPLSEMDLSTDDSGDMQYSGSSARNVGSSHTSSTTYSPQQQHLIDPQQLAATFQGGESGYVQQLGGTFGQGHDWGVGVQRASVSAGVAQGSGFSTLDGSQFGDVMDGMSDAEWLTVLESMNDWDSGLESGQMN